MRYKQQWVSIEASMWFNRSTHTRSDIDKFKILPIKAPGLCFNTKGTISSHQMRLVMKRITVVFCSRNELARGGSAKY